MRKVTRKSLDELAKVMPVISEENQRMYVGGTSGATGYTGTTGTTGVTGGTGYYGGDNPDYAGGNYGGGDMGGSSSSTGYYGTTGTTSSTGYNYGGTGSYTGTAYGDSGFLNHSGAGYPPYAGEGSTSNPNIPNNGFPFNGVIESGSVYTLDNPCPYEIYSIQIASGSWGGGYVEGIGYVGRNQKGSASNPYSLQEAITMMDAGTWKGGYVDGCNYMYPQTDCVNKFTGGRDLSRRDLEKKLVSGFGDIGWSMLSEKIPLLGTVLAIDTAQSEQAIDKVLNYMDTEKINSVYEIVKFELKPTYSNTCDYRTCLTYKYFDRTNGNLIVEFSIEH